MGVMIVVIVYCPILPAGFLKLIKKASFHNRWCVTASWFLRKRLFHNISAAALSINLQRHVHDRAWDLAEHLCRCLRFIFTNLGLSLVLWLFGGLIALLLMIWLLVSICGLRFWVLRMSWRLRGRQFISMPFFSVSARCIAINLFLVMPTRLGMMNLLLALPNIPTRCLRVSSGMMGPYQLIIVWCGSSMPVSGLIPLCIYNSGILINNHIISVIALLCKNLHVFMMTPTTTLRSIRILLLSPGETPSKLFFVHILR